MPPSSFEKHEAAEEVEREKSEAVSFLSLCKWKAPPHFFFFFSHWGVPCLRSCGANTESAWRVRGWGLHRLNRWGATSAFLHDRGSAFCANSGMSLKAEEQVRGARVITSSCLLCFRRWGGTIFIQPSGTCTRGGTHSDELSRYFSLGKSCVFDAIIPKDEWAQAATLSLWVCVCFCVPVKVGSIVSALSWRFFSLLTCCWDFEATDPVDCIQRTELLAFLLLLHTLDWTFNDFV